MVSELFQQKCEKSFQKILPRHLLFVISQYQTQKNSNYEKR